MQLTLPALAGLLAALAVYARYIEPARLVVRHHRLALPDWPAPFDGLTLLHLSDLHVRAGDRRQIALVQRAASLPADLVCLTGDFVEELTDLPACLQALAPLAGRPHVYAVLGNHDYDPLDHPPKWGRPRIGRPPTYSTRPWPRPAAFQADLLADALHGLGIQVLRNQARPLERAGARIWLAGVEDPDSGRANLARALAGVPAGEPVLLLSHSPDLWPQARCAGIRLTLSGHTHGGQVRLPFIGALTTNTALRLPRPHGLFWWDGGALHISAGLGGTTRLRFRCPPEATLLVLQAAAP